MIRVDWLGKIGYGDICSPIAYAHNLSDKTGHSVNLAFHWSHRKGTKTYPNDPETIDERADYVFGLMRQSRVSLSHVYESNHKFEPNNPHTNYEFHYDVHNYWWSNRVHRQTNDRIVVCPSTENMLPFSSSKTWKDPLGDKWPVIIDQLDAEVVSYRTPIDELVNKLLNCRLFIGYHGSCSWVARHLRVPMVIFSSDSFGSRKMFPAVIEKNIKVLANSNQLVDDSRIRIKEFDLALSKYKFRASALRGIITC